MADNDAFTELNYLRERVSQIHRDIDQVVVALPDADAQEEMARLQMELRDANLRLGDLEAKFGDAPRGGDVAMSDLAQPASIVRSGSGNMRPTVATPPPTRTFGSDNQKQSYSVGGTRFGVDPWYSIANNARVMGTGTYGTVISATDMRGAGQVAIKKIHDVFQNELSAKRALRELRILNHLRSAPDIIRIHDIMSIPPEIIDDFNDVYIVTELMETDLNWIIHESDNELSDEHFCHFAFYMLRGLHSMHSAGIMHRDLKPGNVLLDKECTMKLCDFGLARTPLDNVHMKMTEYVLTRWYRAPEVLYHLGAYTEKVDIFALGCVFAEILNKRPILPGDDSYHQLKLIVDVLGPPSERLLSTITSDAIKRYVENIVKVNKRKGREPVPFSEHFVNGSPEAINLIEWMMQHDPDDRPTTEEAMNHPLFAIYAQEPRYPLPPFQDFAFETDALSESLLRRLIYQEMLEFHPDIGPPPQFTDEERELLTAALLPIPATMDEDFVDMWKDQA